MAHVPHPPVEYEVPRNPVRVDDAVGETEDLDREPDGVPHDVVGLTALFSVFVALLIGFMALSGSTIGHIAAIVLAIVAVPVLVTNLRKKADRERDQVHPSR